MIIGNKLDLVEDGAPRLVKTEDGEKLAKVRETGTTELTINCSAYQAMIKSLERSTRKYLITKRNS